MSNPIPLLPCPFCGSTSVPRIMTERDAREDEDSSDWLSVCCDARVGGCGAQSGYRHTQDAAALLWNSRKSALDDAKEP